MAQINTPVLSLLRSQNIPHQVHTFEYLEGGGTARSSGALGLSEHHIVKTLVFEGEDVGPVIVLMHGDCRVDAKALAAQIGARKVKSSSAEAAEAASGWKVGSTNPFCLKQDLPVYAESSIFSCEQIWINGGGRGILVELSPDKLIQAIANLKQVRVALPK